MSSLSWGSGTMPSSSLDPYTRLLASLADAVTKARQSMHGATLFALAAGFLCLAGTLLFVTSIVWVPALLIFSWTWLAAAFVRMAASYGGQACDKTRKAVQLFFNQQQLNASMSEERARHLRAQEAITDQSFLRNILEALPGVDTDRVLERVERLPLFRIVSSRRTSHYQGASVDRPEPSAHMFARTAWRRTLCESHDRADTVCMRAEPRSPTFAGGIQDGFWERVDERDSDGEGMEVEDPVRSPMQELLHRELLEPDMESEQQASWQAGRAFLSFQAIQSMDATRNPDDFAEDLRSAAAVSLRLEEDVGCMVTAPTVMLM